MKLIYKIILALNSTILIVVVYLIKEHIILGKLNFKYEYISYLIYILIVILSSYICMFFSSFLSKDIIAGGVVEIECANNSYLPTYLGYFFVALGIEDWSTLFWVFVLIFIFTFNSQALYFNPMFLLWGYKFYYVMIENGMKVFVISKKEIKDIRNLSFENIVRINDYTYIDKGDKKNELCNSKN